jgi:pimeloyl-ACP methyl ester carboxylesterase
MPQHSVCDRPKLVFVHGGFHHSWVWQAVLDRLTPRGWRIETVDLPSVAAEAKSRAGMYDDAEVIREVLGRTSCQQIVVAHSYGGIPVTQVAHELTQVRHIVYVAALQLDVGQSLRSAAGGHFAPWMRVNGNIATADRPIETFYNDVEPVTAAEAQSRLLPSTLAAFTEPLTAAAWRCVPSTYVICERDQAVMRPRQEAMAQRASRISRLSAGHSPMLSQPEALATIIETTAALVITGDAGA